MAKYDPGRLAEESSAEDLKVRRDAALERVELRVERAQDQGRDLTDRERQLSEADAAEVKAVDEAMVLRRRVDEGREKAQHVFGEMSRLRGHAATREHTVKLREFENGLRAGVPQRLMIDAEVFTRAATTATVGATTAVSARSGRPGFIWSVLDIPFFRAQANTVQGPTWQTLVAQSGTAEGATKPAMADAVLDSRELVAYGVTHEVSDRVVRYGIGEDAVSARLAAEAVYSVNGGIVDLFETHGTEIAFATDAATSVDTAIATVVATTGGATGIIINPADYPALAARAATSAGDVESGTVSGYNGLPFFMHTNMAAGHAIVVNGAWLSAHASDVLMASLPLLDTNEIKLRAEVYAAVLIGDESAVQRVDIASA